MPENDVKLSIKMFSLGLLFFFEEILSTLALRYIYIFLKTFKKDKIDFFISNSEYLFLIAFFSIPVIGIVAGYFKYHYKWLIASITILGLVYLQVGIMFSLELKSINFLFSLLVIFTLMQTVVRLQILLIISKTLTAKNRYRTLGFLLFFISLHSAAFVSSLLNRLTLPKISTPLFLLSLTIFLLIFIFDHLNGKNVNRIIFPVEKQNNTPKRISQSSKMANICAIIFITFLFFFALTFTEVILRHLNLHHHKLTGIRPFDNIGLPSMKIYFPLLVFLVLTFIKTENKTKVNFREYGLGHLLLLIPLGLFYFGIKQKSGMSSKDITTIFYCLLFGLTAYSLLVIKGFTIIMNYISEKYLGFALGILWFLYLRSESVGLALGRVSIKSTTFSKVALVFFALVGIVMLLLSFKKEQKKE